MADLTSRSASLRPRRLLTPVLVFLVARFLAPLLAELATWPLMIRHVTPQNELHAYSTNETIYRVSLTAAAFVAVATVTVAAIRYEQLRHVRWQDHVRHCALLYALGIASGAYSFWERIQGAFWVCWECPPPWALIVAPAIVANALLLTLAGRRTVAA